MVDVQCLSDCDLHKQLEKLGFSAGPILPSTRKAYEKKLVQLLVSPPCEQPAMKRPKKLHGSDHSDGSEDPAVNIVLKGNFNFSKDKGKECKNKPVNETKWQQADMGEPNSDCKNWKVLIKRRDASSDKRKILDIYYLSQKPTKVVRHAARPNPRMEDGCATEEDCCQGNPSLESSFPWSLKLAIFGIFIIVLFVYITVEKKPLLR
ncbi:LEM domain-containing protein 1 [Alexandromys fortis]|uniref:LEM domain-containing protein 1 n=1 Tax=Alexandromys fortis TaxID=100897 RepID=UPI00215389AA|nr:LEM domain-containing protein 1 [Microtus fortis]